MTCECWCCKDKEEREELIIDSVVVALDSPKVQKKLDELFASDFDRHNLVFPN